MGNVFNLFPRLKFCFAHGGGALPFTIGRIQHGTISEMKIHFINQII
jgi:hypothetical protein